MLAADYILDIVAIRQDSLRFFKSNHQLKPSRSRTTVTEYIIIRRERDKPIYVTNYFIVLVYY